MIIGGAEVRTPVTNPSEYDPYWRHTLAKVSDAEFRAARINIPQDELTRLQRRYLSVAGTPEFERTTAIMMYTRPGDSMEKSVVVANQVFGSTGRSQMKDRVEAMLLCPEIQYSHLARAFNMTEHQARVYEKLFFNVRDEKGMLLPSIGLLSYMAFRGADGPGSAVDSPGHWKAVALDHGARSLLTQWRWRDRLLAEQLNYLDIQAELMPMIYRNMEKRLRFEMVDNKSLSEIYGNIIRQLAELQRDGILSSSDKVGIDTLFSKVLQMAGNPRRMTPDEAQQMRSQLALEGKRKMIAESATSGVKVAEDSLNNITRQLKEIDNATVHQ